MRTLVVFDQLSVDGYFVDRHRDMSWAKTGADDEFNRFTSDRASGGGVLLFGRVTYELMASYWPTRQAAHALPVVAERMNRLPKVVFSRTMTQATWNNTTLVKDDAVGHIRRMKAEPGEGMAVLGSGNLVSQLAETGLIDQYEFIVNPLALGGGRTIFAGMTERLCLKLTHSRVFKSGKVFLSYVPVTVPAPRPSVSIASALSRRPTTRETRGTRVE
jgi:dihydrofolate reductase